MNHQRKVLVIDDLRYFQDTEDRKFTYAKNSTDGLAELQKGGWDELWLDHDLGGEDTIRPVVLFMEEYGIEISIIKIITSNPVGRSYIRSAFKRLQERGYHSRVLG